MSKRNGRPETFTAADLMKLDLTSVEQVVEGLVYEGVTLFAGRPKQGKTWMMLAMALGVDSGGTVLGGRPVKIGEVLYLALEDTKRRLHWRIKKLLVDQEASTGVHFALDWPRLDEGGLEALDEMLRERPDIKLVIVDTLARVKPDGSKKRTQYDEDRNVVDSLIPLAEEHKVAIILVHHLREAEADDPLDMIHGSAGLTGGVDSALVLKRRRGEADAYLYGDGRDYETPVEVALKWDAATATWTILGDAEVYAISEKRRAILSVVKSADKPLGPKEVREKLDAMGVKMKDGAVREMLSKMAQEGQVKTLRRGQYVRPDYQ
jgi:hypothetical protein